MDNLISLEELSKRMHKSVKTLLNDRWRNPAALPPAVKFPGSRKVLFLESDVEAHIMRFRENRIDKELVKPVDSQKKSVTKKRSSQSRIGRPTNKSRLQN